MPNIAAVLKQEIARLAKKEAKSLMAGLRSDVIRLKRDNAALKRQLAALEKTLRTQSRQLKRAEAAKPEPESKAADMRITRRTIPALRKRLGLSQADLGLLLGITGPAIARTEGLDKAPQLRKATRTRLAEVLPMGRKEAQAALAELKSKSATSSKKKASPKKAAKKVAKKVAKKGTPKTAAKKKATKKKAKKRSRR